MLCVSVCNTSQQGGKKRGRHEGKTFKDMVGQSAAFKDMVGQSTACLLLRRVKVPLKEALNLQKGKIRSYVLFMQSIGGHSCWHSNS